MKVNRLPTKIYNIAPKRNPASRAGLSFLNSISYSPHNEAAFNRSLWYLHLASTAAIVIVTPELNRKTAQ
jgi:hypothetical protein